MAAVLHFLGTGDSTMRGTLSEAGLLIQTEKSIIHVDPGIGANAALTKSKITNINATYATDETRSQDKEQIKTTTEPKDIIAEHKPCGILFQTPDVHILYLTKEPDSKQTKEYKCDVLILYNNTNAELIQKISPKLCILTGYSPRIMEQNPIYIARDINKATGIQTIAAQDSTTIDLKDYSALRSQKSLNKFTEEPQ